MIAEIHEAAGFWDEYFSLLTDPAHIAFELTLMLIIDVLIITLIWPKVKSYVVRKHDEKFHGSEHNNRKPVRKV